jgi:hypothetical protein
VTEIRNNSVDQRTFELNAQSLGAQRDTVRRKDLAKSASAEDGHETGDKVELGQQEGGPQSLAEKARAHNAARAAMAGGTVQAGDADPAMASPQAAAPEPMTAEPAGPAQGQPFAGANMGPSPNMAGGGGAIPPGMLPPGAGGPTPGSIPPGGGNAAATAQAAMASQQDIQQAQTIYWQMAADRQKAITDMWKIFQDLSTTIFQKMQEVMIYRQQVMDKISQKWSEVLRG